MTLDLPPLLDYARSHITFVTLDQGNQARIQVEASCRLFRPGQEPVDYWLVASCKAEHTYAEGQLFCDPNYDFSIIYGRDDYCIRRIPAAGSATAHESGRLADRFDTVRYDLIPAASPRRGETAAAIVEMVCAGLPMVCRAILPEPNGDGAALLEFPVKTFNVEPGQGLWQIDTGPMLVPAGAAWRGDLAAFDVAFAAARTPDRIEFIKQRPVTRKGERVDAFHAIDSQPAQVEIWGLEG